LVDGVTGLYGNLPPGLGPLLEVSAERVARAFDAWTNGNWELCDAQLAEGRAAAGDIFTGVVERVVSPAYPYRVDSPFWDSFLTHLAVTVLAPAPPPSAPPPRKVESEADFLKRLHRMVAEGEAKRAPVTPAEADELRALGLM
jgi:hypothetical protein